MHLAVSAVALLAVLWPAVRTPQRDSFPLSNYPMFSEPRSRLSSVDVAVGVTANGDTVRLNPRLIAGTDQVIQAARALGDSIRSGTTKDLCSEIATRLDAPTEPDDVVGIEIATETYDVVAWFDGETDPTRRTVHVQCKASET